MENVESLKYDRWVRCVFVEEQRRALALLHFSTTGWKWKHRAGWSLELVGSVVDMNNMWGVTCRIDRITRLVLPDNNLCGKLCPKTMGHLSGKFWSGGHC